MTEPEAEAVVEMLQRCENPPTVTVVEFLTALGTATWEHKLEPTEELQNSVYGSCEEVAEAGEQRVLGSSEARVPEGDGPECKGWGRGWSSMRTVRLYFSR